MKPTPIKRARVAPMTRRMWELASLVAEGRSNKQIAGEMRLTPGTVKQYLYRIYRRLGIDKGPFNNRTRLAYTVLVQRVGFRKETANHETRDCT